MRVKRQMTSATQATIDVNPLYDDFDFYSSITWAKFKDICMYIFRGVLPSVEKLQRITDVYRSDVDDAVLVKGTTRVLKGQTLQSTFSDSTKFGKIIDPMQGSRIWSCCADGNSSEGHVGEGARPAAARCGPAAA